VQSGLPVDCRENFGPRPRSEEHVIPKSLFGRIITTDLCKCCNDHFGCVADHALVQDNYIVEAAKLVGLKETDLWASFVASQVTPRGRKVIVRYRDGEFHPKPSLSNLNELTIPIIDGKLDDGHLKDFKARFTAKVLKKGLKMTDEEIGKRVEALIEKMRSDPTGTYHDEPLGETVEPTQLGNQLTYTRETKPWETHWGLMKITFELSQLLWPRNYRQYYSPLLSAWREFLERRESSSDKKQGVGIFIFDRLSHERASRQHVIEGCLSPTQAHWELTFFGTARWRIGIADVTPINPPPDPSLRFEIVNPIDTSAPDSTITVARLVADPNQH
jgi:hypothetical protein